MNNKSFFVLALMLMGQVVCAQPRVLKAANADHAPKIDGKLDDKVWKEVPVATDFIVSYPTFGGKAAQKTEVKILFGADAVYVGAMLYDDPKLVRRQITARDDEQQNDADYFSIFFDTYNDKQNGFQFLVTSSNVQSDARLGANLSFGFGGYGDKTWDAVWESKVDFNEDGWSVEMKIPYFSLRFSKKEVQDWGLQLQRSVRRSNETSTWSPVDPDINGFVNQFGLLQGITDLEPPLRLSFSPYLSTGYQSVPEKDGYLNRWLNNGGLDLKYGINESFTLDATLIPDFGQVVSDNLVNNLTPFEIQFQENRPFFTEGTELFNKAGLFYSRRVGATPEGYYRVHEIVNDNPDLEIKKNPSLTQLYNAIKVSGRTKKNLGIGVFNAVTAPMHAVVRNKVTGKDSSISTEPLANYNILVLDQSLRGQSYVTFTNTNVMRNRESRNANVSALDVALFDKENIHQFSGKVRYSSIWGAEKYDGFNTLVKYAKVSGKWQYHLMQSMLSENYDPNDLGILFSPNNVTYQGSVSYHENMPTKNFLTHFFSLESTLQYLYKPYSFYTYEIEGSGMLIFHNFWDVFLNASVSPAGSHDHFELRTPGRYLSYPWSFRSGINGSTDSRKKLYVEYGFSVGGYPEYHNRYFEIETEVRYRFGNRFNLELEVNSERERRQLGYAFARNNNGDPIVGFRDNRSISSVLSGIYNFTPRLNVTLRARHYWNRVDYKEFFDVDAAGKLINRPFVSGRDQNVNIFNTDVFLTWDFRLGSRLIIAYKNWLGDAEGVVFGTGEKNNYLNNFSRQFGLKHGNEISARFIYFLDYNQLKRKK
ncbi:MAG: carbohydrate binding family 9 domain-containing protein [Chitinophagales bacterium]|nr:carbohydrate binding family 9 domain-containing protein [Chitinophagales bacterium]